VTADLGFPALILVSVSGVVSGAISLLAFKRWTDGAQLKKTANRILAHFLEIHLYASEPRLVLRAQRDLIVENGRILTQLLRPLLLLLIPYSVLLTVLELFFAHAPLRPGETTLVTVHFKGTELRASLRVPPYVSTDAPGVTVAAERQIVWRVQARDTGTGELQIATSDGLIAKLISVSNGISFISPMRSTSTIQALLHSGEWPLSSRLIDSVAIDYPAATVCGLNWLVWFCISSLIGATVLAVFR
jgi:hypothetical protein